MTIFALFLISFSKCDDIYNNLGIILSPQPNVLSFDTFGSMDAEMSIEFASTQLYQKLLFEKCGEINLTKNYLNFEHKSDIVNPHKFLQSQIRQHLSRYLLLEKFSKTNLARKKRQVLAVAAGALGYEFLHEIYNTFSSHTKTKKLERTIGNIAKVMNIQGNEIENKIKAINCAITENEVTHHENNVKLLIFQELKTLDNILYSLIYRTGLDSSVNILFVQACAQLAMANVDFCQELIESKKFGVKID